MAAAKKAPVASKPKKLAKPFGHDRFIVVKAKYLRMLEHFVSKEEVRYYICGIYIEPNETGGATLVATDGHRMGVVHDATARVRKPFICSLSPDLMRFARQDCKNDPDVAVVFPGLSAHLIPSKLIARTQGPKSASSFATFNTSAPPIDGDYPNWRGVFPDTIKRRLRPMTVNTKYIGDFSKVSEAAGLDQHGWGFFQTGGKIDPLIVRHALIPEFIGLQMPMRLGEIEPLPSWLPAKAA